MATTLRDALVARDKVARIVGDLPGITGVGVSWDDEGQPCVRINIDDEIADSDRQRIPSRVDTVPVHVETVSHIELD